MSECLRLRDAREHLLQVGVVLGAVVTGVQESVDLEKDVVLRDLLAECDSIVGQSFIRDVVDLQLARSVFITEHI